jgi:hypothetical protein
MTENLGIKVTFKLSWRLFSLFWSLFSRVFRHHLYRLSDIRGLNNLKSYTHLVRP